MATTDASVLEGPKSMQPCFAMSSQSVRSLEPSEYLIAAPFLQGPHGYPEQASQMVVAQQLPRPRSVTSCGSRHEGMAFLFEGIKKPV